MYANNTVFILKLRLLLYKIAIKYLLFPFFMLLIHPYKMTFFPHFCFPDIIMYMLNIISVIKTITVNEIVKKQMLCKYQLMTADL